MSRIAAGQQRTASTGRRPTAEVHKARFNAAKRPFAAIVADAGTIAVLANRQNKMSGSDQIFEVCGRPKYAPDAATRTPFDALEGRTSTHARGSSPGQAASTPCASMRTRAHGIARAAEIR
jgi:hypothetical protein